MPLSDPPPTIRVQQQSQHNQQALQSQEYLSQNHDQYKPISPQSPQYRPNSGNPFRESASGLPTSSDINSHSSSLSPAMHLYVPGEEPGPTLSPNSASNKHISFAQGDIKDVDPDNFTIITDEIEEAFDQDKSLKRDKTIMKRHRWGTQRHAKGRPTDTPKRTKSIFSMHSKRHGSSPPQPSISSQQMPNDSSESLDQDGSKPPHKIFINLPVPEDMLDPETGFLIPQYPRNKIRTAKYTPLSFIPKNIFYQFKNIANIYFLFIVILGVSVPKFV